MTATPPEPPSDEARLAALIEAGTVVASGLDLDAVLARLLDLARALTGARYAAVGVLNASGSRIERFVTTGVSAAERAAIGAPPVGLGILGALITDPAAAAARRSDAQIRARPASRPGIRRCGRSWACRSSPARPSSATCT